MCLDQCVCYLSMFFLILCFSDYSAMYGTIYRERNKIQVQLTVTVINWHCQWVESWKKLKMMFLCCQWSVWLHRHSIQRRRHPGLFCVSFTFFVFFFPASDILKNALRTELHYTSTDLNIFPLWCRIVKILKVHVWLQRRHAALQCFSGAGTGLQPEMLVLIC